MERHAERRSTPPRSVTVGSTVCVPPTISIAVAVLEQVVERALLEVARGEAGEERSRGTCSSSTAIGSPSASRRRLTESTGSDGETCRMRPSRAPAGTVRNSSVRLPGVRPRWRMSSLNDVIVMPFATFGSATKVPGAAAARQVALAHELVERGADGQPRDAEIEAEQPLRRDRVADLERLDQLEHLLAGLALLGHAVSVTARGSSAARRRAGGAPVCGSKNWSRPGSTASVDALADARRRARRRLAP